MDRIIPGPGRHGRPLPGTRAWEYQHGTVTAVPLSVGSDGPLGKTSNPAAGPIGLCGKSVLPVAPVPVRESDFELDSQERIL